MRNMRVTKRITRREEIRNETVNTEFRVEPILRSIEKNI